MSFRYTNRSDSTADVLVFQFDPTTTFNSHVTLQSTFRLSDAGFNVGISFPWAVPDSDMWIARSDGSGGFTEVTHFQFTSLTGTSFRLNGNATDGYTFLQS